MIAFSVLDLINLTKKCRTITQSPFIPFIILFCHIIETCEASDLEHIRGLVETLESTSSSQSHSTCGKQRRLFRALYDVAAKYVDVKLRAGEGQRGVSWSMAQQRYVDAFASATSNGLGIGTLEFGAILGDSGASNIANAPNHILSHVEANGDGVGLMDGLVRPPALQNAAFGDVDMDMDLSRDQLWDWFNKNQSFMRMLEDT
jgi:hypothetical protein